MDHVGSRFDPFHHQHLPETGEEGQPKGYIYIYTTCGLFKHGETPNVCYIYQQFSINIQIKCRQIYHTSGQMSIIPKLELREFWEDSFAY